LLDSVSRSAQRCGQCAGQTPRSDNGDPRLRQLWGHARQHSRIGPVVSEDQIIPAEIRKADAVLYIVDMPKSSRSKVKLAKSSKSSHLKARLISSRTVYRGPVFWVTTDHVQEPGGVRARRDVIHHTGSVVVLAVDESRSAPRVLLERQYRHAAKDYLWELPAGRIDPGEKPLPAAQRELL
jgi:hypothetical protein